MSNDRPVAESAGSTWTGVEVIGQVRWGTHFCHFYETPEDLLDILIPYFKAGLEANELCLWVVYDPLTEARPRDAVRLVMPDVDQRIAAGDMLITPHSEWYLPTGAFDPREVAYRWMAVLDAALGMGYAGLRVNAIDTWAAVGPPEIWASSKRSNGRLRSSDGGQASRAPAQLTSRACSSRRIGQPPCIASSKKRSQTSGATPGPRRSKSGFGYGPTNSS